MSSQNYIRESKGNRHYCVNCRKKRYERFMEKIVGPHGVSRFAMQRWRCSGCPPTDKY